MFHIRSKKNFSHVIRSALIYEWNRVVPTLHCLFFYIYVYFLWVFKTLRGCKFFVFTISSPLTTSLRDISLTMFQDFSHTRVAIVSRNVGKSLLKYSWKFLKTFWNAFRWSQIVTDKFTECFGNVSEIIK